MSSHTTDQPNPLGVEPIPKLMVRYAIPSVVAMLVMSIYNIVDQIFIGRSPAGYLGNGATTVAFPLITVMLALALLIGNGSAAFISLQMGRGNTAIARKILSNAVTLLFGVSILLAALVLLFLEPVLTVLGATEQVMPYAIDYTSIIMLGAPFSMLTSALANVIRADGSPRYSMAASLSGAILNCILDPIFIFDWGLGLGVGGAALATILSQMLSAGMVLYYVICKANHIRLERASMRPDPAIVRTVMSYGSSSFVTQISNSIVNVVMNNTLTFYGAMTIYGSDIPLSAMGIVLKINAILLSCILGITIGCQPILGYNYGAGNYARVKRTYHCEILVTTALAGIFNVLFLTTPETFIGLFGDASPLFNEFGAIALSTFLLCITAAGLQIPSANYFQAVGKPLKAMTLTMTRQLFLLVPAILILPLFFGLNGILYSAPFADIAALVITAFFILREMRSLTRWQQEAEAAPAGADASPSGC